MTKLFKKLAVITTTAIIAATTALSLASCSTGTKKVVKIGVCGSKNEYWNAVQKVLDDEDAGIYIQTVEFDAYNLPNAALNSGDIDLNAFQHKAFLQNDSNANGYSLTVIGDTYIAPLTLYSEKYESLDAIKQAAASSSTPLKLGIPDDGTNLSRGIKLLEAAGFIEVDPAAGYTPEEKNITKYNYNVKVEPIQANMLTSFLSEYAGCVINGQFAADYGLVPSKDGLIVEQQDEGGNNPYVNIIVARTADKDNEVYQKIINAYHSQTVAQYLLQKYEETFIPVFEYNTSLFVDGLVAQIDAYKTTK